MEYREERALKCENELGGKDNSNYLSYKIWAKSCIGKAIIVQGLILKQNQSRLGKEQKDSTSGTARRLNDI